VLPLRRGADGKLGVAQTASASPKITINNYSGADVSVQDRSGELEITIAAARKAIADDIARGGNPLSASLERSYGMTRRGR
jgi:hypothetical protein